MQVILLQRVEKLGQMGQVVDVRGGYARNYLLPQNKALRATKQNLSFFSDRRVDLEASNLKLKLEAQGVAEKMDGALINLIRQASEMRYLYGSVRPADIVQGLAETGFKIERSQVQVETPIKHLGIHQVRVLLHPEVAVHIKVNVAQSVEEAAVQASSSGKDLASSIDSLEPETGVARLAGKEKREIPDATEAIAEV